MERDIEKNITLGRRLRFRTSCRTLPDDDLSEEKTKVWKTNMVLGLVTVATVVPLAAVTPATSTEYPCSILNARPLHPRHPRLWSPLRVLIDT